jgi:CheY-like chemotaxis protein
MSDFPVPGNVTQAVKLTEGGIVRKVLYVEDQQSNLLLVEQLIARRANWKLLTAIDGNLGILMAKANVPDVILMDINLPGISGFDVLRILRADPTFSHVPVIALSSNAFPGDVLKGIDAGFFRYLTKPYRISELMNALEDAIRVVLQYEVKQ